MKIIEKIFTVMKCIVKGALLLIIGVHTGATFNPTIIKSVDQPSTYLSRVDEARWVQPQEEYSPYEESDSKIPVVSVNSSSVTVLLR